MADYQMEPWDDAWEMVGRIISAMYVTAGRQFASIPETDLFKAGTTAAESRAKRQSLEMEASLKQGLMAAQARNKAEQERKKKKAGKNVRKRQ